MEREPKPAWSEVPETVREGTERRLGARVVRATRAYGGYAASATFRLLLADGRRAFFKAGYPPPKGSAAIFPIEAEEKRYRALNPIVGRSMPRLFDSFKRDSWQVLLMEDVGFDHPVVLVEREPPPPDLCFECHRRAYCSQALRAPVNAQSSIQRSGRVAARRSGRARLAWHIRGSRGPRLH